MKTKSSQRPEDYTPWVQKFMLPEVAAVGPTKSLTEQLMKRYIKADEIDSVIFRYCSTLKWRYMAEYKTVTPTGTIVGLLIVSFLPQERISALARPIIARQAILRQMMPEPLYSGMDAILTQRDRHKPGQS